jgi:circadian clock protein KaiC
MAGTIQRTVAVVQNRASAHDEAVRQITIDADGMHIGAPVASLDDVQSVGLDQPPWPGFIGDDL